MNTWAGIITPSCGDHSDIRTVSRMVGIGLRIGGEATLCFACGPDGGYYHPSKGETMDSVMDVAERLVGPAAEHERRLAEAAVVDAPRKWDLQMLSDLRKVWHGSDPQVR